MPSPESADFARLLLRKGGEDLEALQVLVESGRAADAVLGFHAQQVIEKSIKAVLAAHEIEIPKTHDLSSLIEVAESASIDVPDDVKKARWLTPWSVEFRYWDELGDELDQAEAVADAERVERWAAERLAQDQAGPPPPAPPESQPPATEKSGSDPGGSDSPS